MVIINSIMKVYIWLFALSLIKCEPFGEELVETMLKAAAMEPVVTIKNGTIRGKTGRLLDGLAVYYSFKGIRYANVTTRFSPPEPVQNWSGVYDATEHGPPCPQFDIVSKQYIPGDENCLFLNVYTKSLNPAAALPVMVFIHGGGYMSGSGDSDTFGPHYLIQHDVILVTFNYRLEVLGFLCLDTPEVPGNAGMKDQVAALRWVQENIRAFGGDPNKVTLFGESAGAASVTLHMQSPMSRNLFHRAIAQSGVSTVDWATTLNAKDRALAVAKKLGFKRMAEDDTSRLLEFLRFLPAVSLTKMTQAYLDEDEKNRGLQIYFGPVIETIGSNPFLSTSPLTGLSRSVMNPMPLMIGYNSAEGIFVLPNEMKKISVYNKKPQYLVPNELIDRSTADVLKTWGQEIKKFYIGSRDFTNNDTEVMTELMSDIHFTYNAHRFAQSHSAVGPTYMYVFSADTELNVVKRISKYSYLKGASHADDLFYLFSNECNKDLYIDHARLKLVIDEITKLWANFAKYGNPTPNNTNVHWKQYNISNQSYMDINHLGLIESQYAHHERVKFWNKMYFMAGTICIISSKM